MTYFRCVNTAISACTLKYSWASCEVQKDVFYDFKKASILVMRKLALTRKSKKEEAFVSSLRNYVMSIINIFMDCNIIILSSPDQKSTTMP